MTSTYLDSPTLQLYRETVEGLEKRFKLRVRAYGSSTDSVFLEVKHRHSGAISKARVRIEAARLHEVLRGRARLREVGDPDLIDEFISRVQHLDARPTIRIRYEREAYVGTLDPGVRVTFDRNLCMVPTDQVVPRPSGGQWFPFAPERVVMELKFRGRHPAWMADCVHRLELMRVSFSKYVHGMRSFPWRSFGAIGR